MDDVFSGLAFTTASHVRYSQLGCIKVISIGSEFLAHQEQPVFKLGFFAIGQHWRVGDLGGLSVGRYWRGLTATGAIHH